MKIRKVLWILMVPVALIVGFYFGALAGLKVERGRWNLPVLNPMQYRYGATDTTRIVLYYVGGSGCTACQFPQTIEAVKRLKREFPDSATARGMTAKFVSITMDDKLKPALKYSTKFGPWDEIHMGSHAWNEFLLEHFNKVKVPAFPQLIVMKDRFFARTDSTTFRIEDKEFLFSLQGECKMTIWANRGYPMDGVDRRIDD